MTMPQPTPSASERSRRLDAWLEVRPSASITLKTGKVELGQGILLALRQIVAEELGVSLDCIEVLSGDTQETPNEAGTVGSMSIETSGATFRRAAAILKKQLIDAAALRLQADRSLVTSRSGKFYLGDIKTEETFWTVVADADLGIDIDAKIELKPRDTYSIVGASLPDNATNKLDGNAFISDMSLEGMLHGRIIRRAHYAAKLDFYDTKQIAEMLGVVHVFRENDLVGVIASDEHILNVAARRLEQRCKWLLGSRSEQGESALELLERLPSQNRQVRRDLDSRDPDETDVRATYTKPLIGHASIGPSCGLAVVHADHAEIWSHSQTIFALRDQIAEVLSLPLEKVRVRHGAGAGCYGHNGADDAAMDAVMLARLVPGRPVRVQWTRKDELVSEPLGSPMRINVAAKLSGSRIVGWTLNTRSGTHIQRPGWNGGPNLLAPAAENARWAMSKSMDLPLHNGGSKNAVALYDFPQHVTYEFVPTLPFRLSALRSLGAFANVFAIEGFMDELADVAGIEPVEFRLSHLSDQRARAVIKSVVERSDWTRSLPEGQGRGLGFARFKNTGTYCAVVAIVEVTERVALKELWASVDAGLPINPAGIRAQIEGGMLQAASWTLKEEVPTRGALLIAESWKDYPILRFDEIPVTDVTVIDAMDHDPTGVGEASLGPTAGAIGNAVANALGIRLRALPLTRDRLIEGMMA